MTAPNNPHDDHNSRPLLVFIHGWSCRASDWDDTLAAIRPILETQYQILAPDLPDHGDQPPALADASIAGLADWLLTHLKAADKVSLVGHSMGGCVALEAAARLGERAKQVILVDTFGLPYGDMDSATIASIEAPFHSDFAAAMHYLVDNTTPATLDSSTRNWIKTRMASAAPEKMLPIWHNLLRWSPDNAFSRIQCPIHAINGEHIPTLAQARCAPYVYSRVLAGCHHFPQFENPELFQHALLDLLN